MTKDFMMTIPSRQWIKAMRKQEIACSKLARDIPNFFNGGGNGGNDYGRNNHGDGGLPLSRHVEVGKFSSYSKSFEHHLYDFYGCYERGNVQYDHYGINDVREFYM